MVEYIDKSEAVDEEYLTDWYISSLWEYADEKLNEPRWTEQHIEELTNDFIVIPKETPAADALPVVHGSWIVHTEWGGIIGNIWKECSVCHARMEGKPNSSNSYKNNFCTNCGAKMDKVAEND